MPKSNATWLAFLGAVAVFTILIAATTYQTNPMQGASGRDLDPITVTRLPTTPGSTNLATNDRSPPLIDVAGQGQLAMAADGPEPGTSIDGTPIDQGSSNNLIAGGGDTQRENVDGGQQNTNAGNPADMDRAQLLRAAAELTKPLPREAWTTSRIIGSPNPPPPYRAERTYAKLKFANPVVMTCPPRESRWYVAELRGKIFSFPMNPDVDHAELAIDIKSDLSHLPMDGRAAGVGDLYGLTFHPDFEQNRFCYLCYTLLSANPSAPLQDGTRVSRFTVSATDPPRIDPASEVVLITWLAGGHNGGCLEFGTDGMLYVSTGDASDPTPPDKMHAGQDVSNLLSSVLRIDVDHPQGDLPYTIPADNPFVELSGARGEIWAYGFRNPWKMNFDRASGNLWLGDVGWELWELIHKVERGGNYGWSIMEGSQPIRPEGDRGPTPISPPVIELPHSEAASITGGFVYHGDRLPELKEKYIFGDWETRRIWAADINSQGPVTLQELVEPTIRVITFAQDHDQELYLVDYDEGTIHSITRNVLTGDEPEFPRKLSETGLFRDTAGQQPATGVIGFDINAPMWSDGARGERWIALPEKSQVVATTNAVPVPGTIMVTRMQYPKHAVLAKTLSLPIDSQQPHRSRKIETQILHFNGHTWRGYSYRWNEEQTDAELVSAEGEDQVITLMAEGPGKPARTQLWHFSGRAECVRCHNPWVHFSLAFNLAQLNRGGNSGESPAHVSPENQLDVLERMGVITWGDVAPVPAEGGSSAPVPLENVADLVRSRTSQKQLLDPANSSERVGDRARSYLAVNCSHCHQFNAGGATELDLRYELPIEQTKTLGMRPTQGTFEMPDALVIAPGDPFHSVLYYRLSKLGRGRMPHLGSAVIDQNGLELIRHWITQVAAEAPEQRLLEELKSSHAKQVPPQADHAAVAVARIARSIAKIQGSETPTASDLDRALNDWTAQRNRVLEQERLSAEQAVQKLLNSTSGALVLSQAIADDTLLPATKEVVLTAAVASSEERIRDLFEKFLPEEKRTRRLGLIVRREELLSLPGDIERGKALFSSTMGVQCKNCHKIDVVGTTIGPELNQIGKKLTKAQILESILEPSRRIEPKFVQWILETTAGEVHSGIVTERTDAKVVLRTAKDQRIEVQKSEIERLVPSQQSMMPELLLKEMSKEQIADLLAYLESLR